MKFENNLAPNKWVHLAEPIIFLQPIRITSYNVCYTKLLRNAATDLATNLNSPNPAHIPSLHAFYVQVDIAQTNGSITVPKEARVGTNFTYLKSGSRNNFV